MQTVGLFASLKSPDLGALKQPISNTFCIGQPESLIRPSGGPLISMLCWVTTDDLACSAKSKFYSVSLEYA